MKIIVEASTMPKIISHMKEGDKYLNDIFLKKEILNHELLNDNAISTYIALRSMYLQDRPITYVSINQLCYELFGNITYTRTMKEKIQDGLNQLIGQQIISVKDQIGKSEYLLDVSGLHIDSSKGTKDYYTKVTLDEIRTIFNVTGRIDKCALAKFFVLTISTINYTETIRTIRGEFADIHNFVGFMPMSYLATIAGVADSVAGSYMAILERQQLLYVFRHTEYKWDIEKNKISSFVNKYGRYKDKEYIRMYAVNYENYSCISTVSKMQKRKDANKRRSLTQKYHSMCSGKKYSEKETQEILEFMYQKNQDIKTKITEMRNRELKEYEQGILSALEAKLLDESVFDKLLKNNKEK